ncbi:hypothetical protein PIB30_038652 [Stylosanthes scabra]|uniref:Uncharacterized protein n=1 Tax=Stylosanthes scabra TaxID=79078 RepID=A0ABU6XC44_9FABA|nr:hypothetical protein [Stylosanthes scabra]
MKNIVTTPKTVTPYLKERSMDIDDPRFEFEIRQAYEEPAQTRVTTNHRTKRPFDPREPTSDAPYLIWGEMLVSIGEDAFAICGVCAKEPLDKSLLDPWEPRSNAPHLIWGRNVALKGDDALSIWRAVLYPMGKYISQ